MNDILRKIGSFFGVRKLKEKSAKKVFISYSGAGDKDDIYNMYMRYFRNQLIFDKDTAMIDIYHKGILLKNEEITEGEVCEKYLMYLHKGTEYLLPIMQEEKIVPSKIRYTQKLADLDRRMKVLEKERQVDKEVRFQQTRTLEYLEANVESLKKQDKPLKIKDKFERLVEKWKEETEFVSTVLEMATHPAYQQIIGMGESAIPLILERLENHSEHWFWALNAITGENPVSKQSYGKVDEMREAWLKWGQTKGYGSPTRARDKRTS